MKTTISENQLNKIILESIKKNISRINENTEINVNGTFTLSDFLRIFGANSYTPEQFINDYKLVNPNVDLNGQNYNVSQWLKCIDGIMANRSRQNAPNNQLLALKNHVNQAYNRIKSAAFKKGWNNGTEQEIPLASGKSTETLAQDAQQAQINRQAPTNLSQWDKLPLYGTPNSRLAFIQKALDIKADGKLGPQTLGTIFQKIGKSTTIGNVTMDPKYLQNVTWLPGRNGTITNTTSASV